MAKEFPQFFKRIFEDYQVLVQVDPMNYYLVIELIVPSQHGKIEKTEIILMKEIFEDFGCR